MHGEVFDVGEYGRFAIVEDPSGATLVAWQTAANGGARRVNDPGCMTWNELQTRDPRDGCLLRRVLRLGDGAAGGR